MTTINSLISKPEGTEFKIISEELLSKLPRLKDITLVKMVVKMSGGRLFLQCNSNTGARTLKLTSGNYEIEILGQQEVVSLASIVRKYAYESDRPTKLKVNANGNIDTYTIQPKFWEQNPTNIKLTGLSKWGENYSVPGSWIVMEEIN